MLFIISVMIFFGVEALPGDLAESILGQAATPESIDAFRRALQLDLPPHTRYLYWIGGILQGELGTSLANNRPIADLLGARIGNTFFLATTAAVVSIPISIALGMLAALYRDCLLYTSPSPRD